MAITFFSINQIAGGGGGSTVVTANGISGDGSIANPVILGVNPLNQATTIDTATFQFLIQTLAANFNTFQFGPTGTFLTYEDSGFTGNAQMSVALGATPATIRARMGLFFTSGNNKFISLSNDASDLGIHVKDDADNLGLIGDQDFSAAIIAEGSGFGYVQLAILSSFLSGTLSGDITEILAGHKITFGDLTGGKFYIHTGDPASVGGQGVLEVEPDAMTIGIIRQGLHQTIQALDLSQGISIIDDIDSIGLTAPADYSAGALAFPGDLAYPQIKAVKTLIANNTATPLVASQDAAGHTTTVTVVTYTLPVASDGMIRVTAYGFYRTGTGSVLFEVKWTDNVVSGTHSSSFGTAISSGNIVSAYPTLMVKAKANTAVTVTATLTGTMTYDSGATVEFLAP